MLNWPSGLLGGLAPSVLAPEQLSAPWRGCSTAADCSYIVTYRFLEILEACSVIPTLAPGIVVGIVGLYLTSSFARDVFFAEASVRWRKTRGRIIERGGHQGTSLARDSVAALTYEYRVDGERHVGRRFDYAGRGFGNAAGAVLLRHQHGASVDVYYDPRRPSRAVLHPGSTAGNYLRLLLAVLFILVGLMLLLAPSGG
jgi:hypothetical protein